MVLSLAPTWMISGYVRSLQALGARADKETLQEAASHLAQIWSDPGRTFHNLKHVTEVLSAVDQMVDTTRDPDLVRVAAWYHGIVFNTDLEQVYSGTGGEDPAASAVVCGQELAQLGVGQQVIDQIVDMLRSLAEHRPGNQQVNWMVLSDADLAILATDPQSYREYCSRVREEYPQVPPADFVRSRIAILEKLLARPQLYYSNFAQSWEKGARENLTAELEILRAELASGSHRENTAEPSHTHPTMSALVPKTLPSDKPSGPDSDEELSSMEDLDIPPTAPVPIPAPVPAPEAQQAPAAEPVEPPASPVEDEKTPAEHFPSEEELEDGAELEDEEDFNPYAQADEADLVCSMESCEELFDTLAIKKAKLKDSQSQ